MDALSELLRAVKLSGAMFFNAECVAPWCVRSPASEAFAPYVATAASRIIEFHLIADGRGYIRVGEEATPLTAGDIVMLPHGDPHFMGNGQGGETVDGSADLPRMLSGRIELSRMGGGEGERTRLICGYLACEARMILRVLAGLPRVLRVHIRQDPYGELLENMIRHAVNQVTDATPGGDAIAARMAEVLFAEVLRRYVLQLPSGRTGWLAGAADPGIGRALAAMHQRPGHAWSLDLLAREAGVSRSVLTERFARYLGQAPMAYLADWRLELGAESLRTTSRSVVQIAEEVGYESQAAFNRAFKRRFSTPPARYRRSWRTGRPQGERFGEQLR
ncbi:MAG: cupin domain-containing protein [Gammaproteobacteria bacterium]